MAAWLRGDRDPEQIERPTLNPRGRGKDSGDAIAPEADDIARERGKIGEQGVEAMCRERFAMSRVGVLAGGFTLRCRGGSTACHRWSQVRAGIEPTFADLQSAASPLCHRTKSNQLDGETADFRGFAASASREGDYQRLSGLLKICPGLQRFHPDCRLKPL